MNPRSYAARIDKVCRETKEIHEKRKTAADEPPPGPPEPQGPPHSGLVRYIKNNLYIQQKGGGPAQFNRWWRVQRRLAALIVKRFYERKPVRIVVHKSRQLGISTLIQAFMFGLVRKFQETNALVVADTNPKAIKIFTNVDRFHNYLSDEEKAALPVKGGRANRKDIRYKHPHNSEFLVGTSKRAGASMMLNWVHVSEAAYIDNFDEMLNEALLPTVPKANITPWTMVVVESTACGKNHFYNLCKLAQDPASDWDFVFIGWKDDPYARIPLEPGEDLKLDERETAFMEEFELDLEQIKWARWIRINECGNSWEKFHQEYPVSSELSFQFAGSAWFDRIRVHEDLESASEPQLIGALDFISESSRKVEFIRDPFGNVKIWQLPAKLVKYVIGMDVSEGIGQDFTVAFVMRVDTGEVVAQLRTNSIEAGMAGVAAYQLGMYYNRPLIACERNGPGLATLQVLRDGHPEYPQMAQGYSNLYYSVVQDKRTKDQTEKLGFMTTSATKDPALLKFKENYNSGRIKCNSRDLLWEMDGFGKDINLKKKYVQNNMDPESRRYHDDTIVASAIAYTVRDYAKEQAYCGQPVIEDF